jgi:hypothetical protein
MSIGEGRSLPPRDFEGRASIVPRGIAAGLRLYGLGLGLGLLLRPWIPLVAAWSLRTEANGVSRCSFARTGPDLGGQLALLNPMMGKGLWWAAARGTTESREFNGDVANKAAA